VRSTTPPPAREVSADDTALALVRSRGLLDEHLQRLRELPAAHGNAKLHADQLVLGLLLAFFEPMARSLRQIEGCGDFDGRLDLPRLARSTTADALAAFDPAHLRPLIDDLRARCPGLQNADADLAGIARRGSSPPTARISRPWPTSPGRCTTPSATADGRGRSAPTCSWTSARGCRRSSASAATTGSRRQRPSPRTC
jgi:hypothetical protein